MHGAMEKLPSYGHPGPRILTRRTAVRTICLLALFALIYHVFTSVELRKFATSERASTAIPSNLVTPTLATDKVPPPVCVKSDSRKQIGKEKATLLMLVRYAPKQSNLLDQDADGGQK